MRTCGLPWSKCTAMFESCAVKVCDDNTSCYVMSGAVDVLIQGGDSHFAVCKNYRDGLEELCDCVPLKAAKDGATARLTSFYSEFSPERLDQQGNIKDVEAVWKKWKGREPELYFELTKKYNTSALEVKDWPEAEVNRWKAKEEDDRKAAEEEEAVFQAAEEERAKAAQRFAEEQERVRQEAEEKHKRQQAEREEAAEKRAAEEEAKKAKRKAEKEKREKLRKEVDRLREEKKKAIAAEDYMLAKTLKAQLDAIDAEQYKEVLQMSDEL